MRNQTYFSAYLPPELVTRLKALSEETRVPMSVIMRDALPDALNRWQAEWEIDRLRRLPLTRWVEDRSPAGNWDEPQDCDYESD